MDACTILQRTATFFRENPDKWIQGSYEDEKGGYCLIGRVMREGHGAEMGGMVTESRAASKAEAYLLDVTRTRYKTTVTTFNDKTSTTLGDVLRVVDAAIRRACR